MELRQLAERYLALAGEYGRPVELAAFGWTREETERVFSILDEDYQISRFLKFSCQPGAAYHINGFPQTHVAVDAAIAALLGPAE